MFLQKIRIFLVVSNDREWIVSQSDLIKQRIASESPASIVRFAPIPEYTEFIKTLDAGTDSDAERLYFSRVLFVWKKFREECAENRKAGVLVISGYILGQGPVERLISYMNISGSVDSIEQVITLNSFVPRSDVATHFPPYCGSYRYRPLDKKISDLTQSPFAFREYDFLLIVAKEASQLMLYCRETREFLIVHSPFETRKDGKSYSKLMEWLVTHQTSGKDAVFALRKLETRDLLHFACSRVYFGTRGVLSKPKTSEVVEQELKIKFDGGVV